jgi:hypothetical protein
LLWFASKVAVGKVHLTRRLFVKESKKKTIETLLQLSATNPISKEFLILGIGKLKII